MNVILFHLITMRCWHSRRMPLANSGNSLIKLAIKSTSSTELQVCKWIIKYFVTDIIKLSLSRMQAIQQTGPNLLGLNMFIQLNYQSMDLFYQRLIFCQWAKIFFVPWMFLQLKYPRSTLRNYTSFRCRFICYRYFNHLLSLLLVALKILHYLLRIFIVRDLN